MYFVLSYTRLNDQIDRIIGVLAKIILNSKISRVSTFFNCLWSLATRVHTRKGLFFITFKFERKMTCVNVERIERRPTVVHTFYFAQFSLLLMFVIIRIERRKKNVRDHRSNVKIKHSRLTQSSCTYMQNEKDISFHLIYYNWGSGDGCVIRYIVSFISKQKSSPPSSLKHDLKLLLNYRGKNLNFVLLYRFRYSQKCKSTGDYILNSIKFIE